MDETNEAYSVCGKRHIEIFPLQLPKLYGRTYSYTPL